MKRTMGILVVALALILVPTIGLAYEWPVYDLGGATVSFVHNSDILTIYFGDEATFAPGRAAEAEKLFNCKLQWVNAGSNPNEVMSARLMAGESQYDIWTTSTQSMFYSNAAAGWYCPVTELFPQEYLETLPPAELAVMDVFSFRGEKYAISPPNRAHLTSYFIWNKTMFKENGWPMLDELYLNDEFTWDAVTEIAIQATKDFDGDGVNDQWGLGIIPTNRFVIGTGGKEVVLKDGKYVFAMDSPESIAAIEQCLKWRSLGVEHGYWSNELFGEGKVAMTIAESWMILGWPIFMADRDFEIGILPYPRRADADRYIFPMDNLPTYILPANSAKPEAMVALINFLFPADELYDYFYEDWMASIGQDPVSYEVAYNAIYNWTGEASLFWWELTKDGSVFNEVWWNEINNGAKPPATALAEIKDVVQASLDDLLGQ